MITTMKHNGIIEDFKRFYPAMVGEYGVFNLDLSVYLPFEGQEDLLLDFGLFKEDILTYDILPDDIPLDEFMYRDIVHNHRFRNKDYVTLSRKLGQRISKTGYPVIEPVDFLNKYRMLAVRFGTEESYIYFGFLLSLNLTEEKPYGGIDLKIMGIGQPKKEFTISVKTAYYCPETKATRVRQYCYAKGGHVQDNAVMLTPRYLEDGEGAIGFTPGIEVCGQAEDSFFI